MYRISRPAVLRAARAVAFVAIAFCVSNSRAQNFGSLSGEIVDQISNAPIAGVAVHAVLVGDTAYKRATYTNAAGKYRFHELLPGKYVVTSNALGYHTVSATTDILVGQASALRISVQEEPLHSDDIVVTASRKEEKVTEAAAPITSLSARDIAQATPTVISDHLAEIPGLDISHEGIRSESYASRGYNSTFSSNIYTLIDNRSTIVPGLEGTFAESFAISNLDIDHIEVVRGPGAALYGPGASEGVVQIITKSPFASLGTQLSVSGGERDLFSAELRHAMMIGDRVAFKVSGSYFRATDWDYRDSAESANRDTLLARGGFTTPQSIAAFDDTTHVGHRNNDLSTYTVEGRLDALLSDDMTLTLSSGLNTIKNAIQMTSTSGAAQIRDWGTSYFQGKINYKDLFAQAYYNKSNSTNTFLLRTGDPVTEASTELAFQLQHHYYTGIEELTYGADVSRISPLNSIAYGVNSGQSVSTVSGGYIQSKTKVIENTLDLILAMRVDKQTELDQMLYSPRAALVMHPVENHTIRLMYNQTTTPPGIDAFYYDLDYAHNPFGLPAPYAMDIRLTGTISGGSHFAMDPATNSYLMHSSFADPKTAIPVAATATALWPALQALAAAGGADISKIPAPTPAQVSAYMAMFDGVGGFNPVTTLSDPIGVKPEGHQVFELDYQAQLTKSFEFEIDGYRSHIDNYRALWQNATPNVFVNGQQLAGYFYGAFRQSGMDSATAMQKAGQLANSLARVPLGTVTPAGATHPTDLLFLTPAYYGNVNYYGLDFTTGMQISDAFSIEGGFSWVSKNFFDPRDDGDTVNQAVYFNIPKYKSSVALRYLGLLPGLNVEARHHWYDGFNMRSGPGYQGYIAARNTVDLILNYAHPDYSALHFTLAVQNLFDYRHEEFIGAPYIGRLATLRAMYTLPN